MEPPKKEQTGKQHVQEPSKQPTQTKTVALTEQLDLKRRMPVTVRDQDETQGLRVENCVGFTHMPLGLAGPLTIHGENQKGTFHAPLATHEATLVASCSRGCKAIQDSGGIHAAVLEEGMSRAPMFQFENVGDAIAFYRAIPSFQEEFRRSAEATSRHAKLVSITPHLMGMCVHVRFAYTTGDAGGQNMTTLATHAACSAFIKKHKAALRIQGFMIEGQMASDKKMSWGNVSSPRGVRAVAWAVLSDKSCREVLGNPSAQIYDRYQLAISAVIRNGMAGCNVNVANVMAAMFIATGQDAASVLEGGWSQLTLEYNASTGDLTVFLFLPSLPVGTVGGGTGLKTQSEALRLLDCQGLGKKWKLAETMAAFALALEISTHSAVSNDTFSQSHQRMARL